jgi:hypothetical protein
MRELNYYLVISHLTVLSASLGALVAMHEMVSAYENQMLYREMTTVEKEGSVERLDAMECTSSAAM